MKYPGGDAFHELMNLVNAALELPPSARAAFLEERCREDPALLERAHRMLEAASEPVSAGLGGRIESTIQRSATSVMDDRGSYPDRIGPYDVTEVLGEGGMGVVLAAEQAEPVARKVAIKLIRAGVHAPRIVARFQAERQTLATLEHPHIAKLYDAGSTPDGLPFFVMELIRGEPLTEYCDRHKLGLEERIRLFRVLLDAVQHAHQKTIVHRDLKPSNVMVAEVDGRPLLKVIDFGIARVASGEAGMTGLTGLGGGMGTLEYMSPERVLKPGMGADTRADVYSLGVMLYELVCGRPPLEPSVLRGASPTELERILMRGPRTSPSRRLGDDPDRDELAKLRASDVLRLQRRIRGDLETIIATALAGDPARRYESVARLDEDLGRFLQGRTITARPRTLSYRARKFAARNRVAVAASTVAITLIAGMAGVFTARLAAERDRAQLEAEKAQRISGFLQSLFEVADPATPAPGDMTARELLDVGAQRIESELADRPDLQSSLFSVVGRTYEGLGLWDEAETYLSRAVELERRVGGEGTLAVAGGLYDLGGMLTSAGRLERADSVLRRALALQSSLLGPRDPRTASTAARLAAARRALGDYEEAETLARRAVSVLRTAPDADREALGDALHTLGFVLRSRASLTEAEATYREALALRRELFDPVHPSVLQTMSNLALTLEARGEYEEAESLLTEALASRRQRLGEEHPGTLTSLNNLAYMLWRTGQYPRATELFEEAVEIGRKIYPEDNPTLAILLNNLGVAQRRIGDLEASERTHRAALAMNRRLFGDRHPRIAGDMDNLGRTLLLLGRAGEAEVLHADALAMRTELLGEDHPDRATSLGGLGQARLALARDEDGMALLEEALRIRLTSLGPDNPRTGQSLQDLGVALLAKGDLRQAEDRLREALRVRRKALGDDHPDVAVTLTWLGRLLREDFRYQEAEAALLEAQRISLRQLAPDDPDRVRVEKELALLAGNRS